MHSNAEAYVIDGLQPAEAAEYEQHLSTCAECQAEVAALRELTSGLSAAVATDPPPALRAAILAEIATTPQEMPAGRHSAPADAGGPAEPASNVLPMERRSRSSRVFALVAAAAVVAAIAVGGWAIQSRNDARDDASTYEAQVTLLTSLLATPDVQTASVPATDGGTATVVRSADKDVAMLVASDLPELPSGKVYEAWTFDGDTPVAAGTFEQSDPRVMHQLPSAGISTPTVAVTVEPEGGTDTPTSDPVAVLDLS
jgi:hypothetical protein